MRRLALALLVLIAACGDDEPSFNLREFAEQVGAPDDLREDSVDGVTIYVSDSERVVYVEDCDTAENDDGTGITQRGEYGPKDDENGYASICPS